MIDEQEKKKSHVFVPGEIFMWLLTIILPYFAACYLVLVTNIFIRTMRSVLGAELPWLDAIIVDLFSTSLFIFAGSLLAPRMKFYTAIAMCIAALYIHFDPAGVHGFMTETVLGLLPESLRSMLPETGTFCSDNPLMYVGVIIVGAAICFSEWKLSQARTISENAYKESINSLYNPGQK